MYYGNGHSRMPERYKFIENAVYYSEQQVHLLLTVLNHISYFYCRKEDYTWHYMLWKKLTAA